MRSLIVISLVAALVETTMAGYRQIYAPHPQQEDGRGVLEFYNKDARVIDEVGGKVATWVARVNVRLSWT